MQQRNFGDFVVGYNENGAEIAFFRGGKMRQTF